MNKIYPHLQVLFFIFIAGLLRLNAQPPCSGPIGTNTMVTPVFSLCPGAMPTLSLGTNYTVSGITYSWSYATSVGGPYTAIPSGTLSTLTTPSLANTMFFNVVVTCTNGGANLIAIGVVSIQGVTTGTPPYYESFEGIPQNNILPNCSWAVSNITTARTYTAANANNRIPYTGSKYASFYVSPNGQNYYYTHGLYLSVGITYSAGLMYISEPYPNFTDLSILVGPNQSTVGQFSVATTGGPAVTPIYKPLGGTFTVASPGYYYVAVKGTSAPGTAQYLTWDDLSVTIPCSPTLNVPQQFAISGATAICSGGTGTTILSATGADTYSWSTGATSNTILATGGTYYCIGTNSLTGCPKTLNWNITINPSPLVSAFASPPTVCSGKQVQLVGGGSNTYTWSTGATGALITVTPGASGGYTVTGSGPNGCVGTASVFVTVNPSPVVTTTATSLFVCTGETTTLIASGAAGYQWNTPAGIFGGSTLAVSPLVNTSYSVSGTDGNSCIGYSFINIFSAACPGFKEFENGSGNVKIYPNPNGGDFYIETRYPGLSKVAITDELGRVVYCDEILGLKNLIRLEKMSQGIYYLKIQNDENTSVIKVMME